MSNSKTDNSARSGGNAAAAGMAFQADVAAQFALSLLGERTLDHRLDLADSRVISVRCETEAPVDDILVETSDGGHVFIQAKTTLDLSAQLGSALGSCAEQAVRLWIACEAGNGERRWDKPFDVAKDRIVFATGFGSSRSVTETLTAALLRYRSPVAEKMTQGEQGAFDRFSSLIMAAWQAVAGRSPFENELDQLLKLIRVLAYDFDGADRTAATEVIRNLVVDEETADTTLQTLRQSFLKLIASRRGVDAATLRSALAGLGIRLNAPPSYVGDVNALQMYSDRVRKHLEDYERTAVFHFEAKINRRCTEAVLNAARADSLLLVGEPGAGKSAVISAAAGRLRAEGKTVIELAVDRLPVSTLDALRTELELGHSLISVLRYWPGDDTAFLFIDALDATRGGQSEAVFRALIAEVLNLPNARWRVIASIRSFDLRMGDRFRELFVGNPPSAEFLDASFGRVKHLNIPHWTPEELEEIEQLIPPIRTAFENGGSRLRELAAVPFNTRLLADLLGSGVSADQFGAVTTQVQLLGLYWSKRVVGHGQAAELCLRRAVEQMIATRGLRAERLHVAEANPEALDALLSESVLVTLAGGRYIAFRHHILFDYAASRVYLDGFDVKRTAKLLSAKNALGLMLGPALVFALQDVWSSDGTERTSFWNCVVHLTSDSECDPVIRSVAARVGCELPSAQSDFEGMIALLRDVGSDKASATIPHLVGSLSVRAEDKVPFPVSTWCKFACEISAFVEKTAWPLRTLLFLLIEKTANPLDQSELGTAARRLLSFGFSAERGGDTLVAAAIGFVGDTYSTDIGRSRELLQKLFEPARFEKYGHEEVPGLARKISEIVKSDPQFGISVYARTFAATVSDETETSLGNSRILPLRSNRRQDFEMAQWSLSEFFPKFLESNPKAAALALVEAIEGYVARSHPYRPDQKTVSLEIAGKAIIVAEDWSHIWAHDPHDPHHDNAQKLAYAFLRRMETAPPEDVVAAANVLIDRNRPAFLWARLILAGGSRMDVLGHLLWPIASHPDLLTLPDTTKDSTDFVAIGYSLQTEAARAKFEHDLLNVAFPNARDPADMRAHFLSRVLGTVGLENLVTYEARSTLQSFQSTATGGSDNARPFTLSGVTARDVDDAWWLQREGVDTHSVPNAEILSLTRTIKTEFQSAKSDGTKLDFNASLLRLDEFLSTVDRADEIHERIRDDAVGVFGEALNSLVSSDEKAAVANYERIEQLSKFIDRLSSAARPELHDDTEKSFEQSASWGSPAPRVDAAYIALTISRASKAAFEAVRATIERLLRDRHPAVRSAIASHVNMLWELDRPFMWKLAHQIVLEETNLGVLRFFASSVLGRLVWSAPEEVETLVDALRDKTSGNAKGLAEEVGGLVGLLWIGSGRVKAKETIKQWLGEVDSNQEFIDHCVSILRGNIIAGYGSQDIRLDGIRKRSLELASWVIDKSADGLSSYFAVQEQTPAAQEYAKTCSRILNHVGNQFYFSSGVFRNGNRSDDAGLEDTEQKRAFLNDALPLLSRMSDVASPATLHHLIELFEFLIPADPAGMFDLVAYALLGAGKSYGYQFESLGADRVVAIVGRFLADDRSIFEDDARRKRLIECLDVFIEAGWPSARRLLYRLPELLQ